MGGSRKNQGVELVREEEAGKVKYMDDGYCSEYVQIVIVCFTKFTLHCSTLPVPGSVCWEVGVADLEPPWAELVAGCWNQTRLYQ